MNMNTPKEVAQNYIAAGVAKTKLPISKMTALGVLAGIFIALPGAGSIIVSATVTSGSIAKLLSGLIFPTGLIMVLLAGSELFTGNCLIIIPVMQKEVRLRLMLKNWCFVYIGNFIGSILVAALTVYGGTFSVFGGDAAVNLIKTAVAKVSLPFTDAIFRGILCNFLVCVAVWITFAAKDVIGKVFGLYFPIMLFVLSSYEHCVANMFYIPAGLFAANNSAYLALYNSVPNAAPVSALNWVSLFTKNIIPVTIGNIIGGVFLVGMMYWFIYLRESKPPQA